MCKCQSRQKVMRRVPEELKELAKATVSMFGSAKDQILLEYIIKYDCIEESHLLQVLEFDRAVLEQQLSNLLKERSIHKRTTVIRGEDGRTKPSAYYFVNYKSLVDIVHYKLHHMREGLVGRMAKEAKKLERVFKCSSPKCRASFKEVQARELFSPSKGTFFCTFCHSPVEENDLRLEEAALKSRMSKFNEYTQPLLDLARAASAFYFDTEPPCPSTQGDVAVQVVCSVNNPAAVRYTGQGREDKLF